MKNLFISALMLWLPNNIFAQSVSNVPLTDINVEYISLEPVNKFMSNKIMVEVDFGQKRSFIVEGNVLKDENNKPMEFNSIIEAINYFTKYGFELIEVNTQVSNDSNKTLYYLKKKR